MMLRSKVLRYFLSICVLIIPFFHYSPPMGYVAVENERVVIQTNEGPVDCQNEIAKNKFNNLSKIGRPIGSRNIGTIGIGEMQFDTILLNSIDGAGHAVTKYFFTINNIYVREKSPIDGATYTVEKGLPYFSFNNSKEKAAFFMDLKNDSKSSLEENAIMFPISKRMYDVCKVGWIILAIIIAFCFLSIFFGGIMVLVERIGMGEVFSSRNVFNLRTICWVCFALPAVYLFLNIIIWVLMEVNYPGWFGLNPAVYFNTLKAMLVGLFFFALYSAFKKGYKLQQENDLTV